MPARTRKSLSLPMLSEFQSNVLFIVGIVVILADVALAGWRHGVQGADISRNALILHGVFLLLGGLAAMSRRLMILLDWAGDKLMFWKK